MVTGRLTSDWSPKEGELQQNNAGSGLAARQEPDKAARIAGLLLILTALTTLVAVAGRVAADADGETGHIRFNVTDTATGDQWVEYPDDWLTSLQTDRMPYQPDMILQTAHIIAEEAGTRGLDVEVRADSFVSFNGREATRFIDPEVDLAQVEPGLWAKTWVLPAPTDT